MTDPKMTRLAGEVEREHRELARRFIRLDAAFARPLLTSDWASAALADLTALQSQLKHHFAQEDEDGLMDEATSCVPCLTHEAVQLAGEHAHLLERLARLIGEVELLPLHSPSLAGPDRGGTLDHAGGLSDHARLVDLSALLACWQDLSLALKRHEAAEERLLQRGFGVDLDLG